MAVGTYDLDTAASFLSRNMAGIIEERLRNHLKMQADEIIAELARGMAKSLSGSITHWDDFGTGKINISIVIDGVQK